METSGSKTKKNLRTCFFIMSLFFQLLWLISMYNFGDWLIGRGFRIDDLKMIFSGSVFYVIIGFFCIALVFLLLSVKPLMRWEIVLLLLAVLAEISLIGIFIIYWFMRCWIRDPPTSFGLEYPIGMILIACIPLAIHAGIVVKNRSLLSREKRRNNPA